MEIIILDLEWNTAYSKENGCFVNEIIEFGAVKLDTHLRLKDTFQMFVKSKLSKKLRGKVKELTHISNDDLQNNGKPFSAVALKFMKWAGSNSVIVTWSNSDVRVLIDNCKLFLKIDKVPFLHNYLDLQKYTMDCLNADKSKQLGLSSAAQMLNIDFESMSLHRAVDDSFLCLEVLKKIYYAKEFKKFIYKVDGTDFYERLLYKPISITDYKSPFVEEDDFRFCCDKCSEPLVKRSRWKIKNKQFCGEFYCKSCSARYEGRVHIRKMYDSVSVRKNLIPKNQEQE